MGMMAASSYRTINVKYGETARGGRLTAKKAAAKPAFGLAAIVKRDGIETESLKLRMLTSKGTAPSVRPQP